MRAMKTRLCPGCHQARPSKEFPARRGRELLAGAAYVCRSCQEKQPKRLEMASAETRADVQAALAAAPVPAAEVLERRDAHLLKLLEGGSTLAEAEKACGYLIGGAARSKLLRTEEFRLGLQALLIERGLDRARLADALLEGYGAVRKRGAKNAEGGIEWIDEPDYGTRLRTAQLHAQLLDVLPRTHATQAGASVVIIHTNLGSEGQRSSEGEGGAYVVDVTGVRLEDALGAPS